MKAFLELGKYSVIIPVSLTAFTGFFLYSGEFNSRGLLVVLGVFFLGMSASALNQVQEKVTDSRMNRTLNRPLPSGRLRIYEALVFIILTFAAGSLLLFLAVNLPATILGVFTIVWYNGVYTPMKKYTAFAVIPGSLTGAIPPVIGWTAAGGNALDPTSVLLAFLFFMGQVPHFWFLIMKYGDQYQNAGLPSLIDVFSTRQINNLSFIWVSASMVSALMLAFFGILKTQIAGIVLILVTISGIFLFRNLINSEDSVGRKKYFILLNSYYLILVILLIVDKIIA